MTDASQTLTLEDLPNIQALCGEQGVHLKIIDRTLRTQSSVRGSRVVISGEKAHLAQNCLLELCKLLEQNYPLTEMDVAHAARLVRDEQGTALSDYFLETIITTGGRRSVSPRSAAQLAYVRAIQNHDIVFGIGPAGTGKTYLAVAMAVQALRQKRVNRIILVRPAVEAGERLGFLPGDMREKVDPYVRPLFDALHDTMGADRTQRAIDAGVVEVAPLAFMRGRTLNRAFVILDEAQNTTGMQMKMLLTRLGYGSKAVITGDRTQIDLVDGRFSGLVAAQRILKGIPEISFCSFSHRDVVRHHLVQDIIQAYDRDDARRRAAQRAAEAEAEQEQLAEDVPTPGAPT